MAFDKLLKRHFWAALVLLTAIAGFLDAQGMMQFVGAGLGPDEKQLATPPLAARLATAPVVTTPHATSATPILHRNAFDSVTGPLDLPPPTPETADEREAPTEIADPYSAPDCEGITVLIIAASADPDWSFAALETQQDKSKTFLRRRGGEIAGKTVRYVGSDRVWLTTNGHQLCQSQVFKPAVVAAATPPSPPPEAPPQDTAGGPALSADIKNGIRRVGPNEFDVDRGIVDKILENQADLMKTARIVPDKENGKLVGIRLLNFRPDSLLGTLGMESGDRLEKINGFDMTSPEKALEAYARLRTADHLTVSLNRRGQPTNLDFNIK
jgi:general secretion pathway protein C